MIDLLLVLILVGYAVSGFRQGLVVSLLSLAGFLGGGALAMWGLPMLLERWMAASPSDLRRVLVIVVGVVALASIGQAIGVSVGTRRRIRRRPVTDAPGIGVIDQPRARCDRGRQVVRSRCARKAERDHRPRIP